MGSLHDRHETRYEVAAPVTFWWLCADGSIHAGEGVTRDISDRGVSVIAKECPPVRALVQMTIALPGSWDKGRGITLHGEGTVVRVGNRDRAAGRCSCSEFAASVQFYSERTGTEDDSDQRARGPRLHTHTDSA